MFWIPSIAWQVLASVNFVSARIHCTGPQPPADTPLNEQVRRDLRVCCGDTADDCASLFHYMLSPVLSACCLLLLPTYLFISCTRTERRSII